MITETQEAFLVLFVVKLGRTLPCCDNSLTRPCDLRTSDLELYFLNHDIKGVTRHCFGWHLNKVVLSALGTSLVTLVDEYVKKVLR